MTAWETKMENERDEALRLAQEAGFTTMAEMSSGPWIPHFIELIRLARAQPAQEPFGSIHDGEFLPWDGTWHGGVLVYTSQPAQPVPEGWVLVPMEPTREMLRKMEDATPGPEPVGNEDPLRWEAASYRAALSAAPKPEEKP